MSTSYTSTKTTAFTITNARYLAAKVISDLELCAEYYGKPSKLYLEDYKEELVVLLKGGYLKSYEFGFQKDDKRVVSWFYTVDSTGIHSSNDRPGKVYRKADISGASYFNFVSYSPEWSSLGQNERDKVKEDMPVSRKTGDAPSDGAGYWKTDNSYHSGGRSVGRKTFIPL